MEDWKKDAEDGDQEAQCQVAYAYYQGSGVKKDLKESLRWYEKAAEQENPLALCKLGYMYTQGEGCKKDFVKGFEYYLKAAELGDKVAQNNLAVAYESGKGVTKDNEAAIRWYKESAMNDYVLAEYNLAVLYEDLKDYSTAAEWYLKAANHGNAAAQDTLGRFYEFGDGVEKNLEVSMHWYKMAAKQNYFGAYENYKRISFKFTSSASSDFFDKILNFFRKKK